MNRRVSIAFYKGYLSKNLTNRIISLFTFSKYSHVELVINGVSYSSRSESNGVIDKLINYERYDNEWDIIDIEISNDSIDNIMKFFNETKGTSYDYIGIFLYHFIPINIEDPKRYYCSEWIAKALKFEYPNLFNKIQCTPKNLYKKLLTIKK